MAWIVMQNEDGSKTLVHSDLYDDVRDFLVDNRELLNDHLAHYGLPRRSGRYKWGSGKDPYQSTGGKRSFKKAASAGERYIMSKLGSSKRAQKKAAKAREKEENEKAKANKYRDEKAYVKSLSDEELRRINTRDQMESQYLKNHPQKKPLAKKMVDMAVNDILIPAISETVKDEGKKYVKKQIKELQNMLNNTAKKSNKKK